MCMESTFITPLPGHLVLTIESSGGAILAALLSSEYGLVKKCTISCLVRGEDKARILASQGVRPILFNSLDETDVLARVASEHDGALISGISFQT